MCADLCAVDVNDDTELTELIDYGSFPRWESSACLPIYSLLQLGPPPSVCAIQVHNFHWY